MPECSVCETNEVEASDTLCPICEHRVRKYKPKPEEPRIKPPPPPLRLRRVAK